MIRLATTSMNCVFDKKKNLEKILKMIDEAADNQANLIVFPEACLMGYLRCLTRVSYTEPYDEYAYHHKNAEVIPEGPCVKAIIKKAMERKIYVAFGMTEKDALYDFKIYNSVCFVGPEGYIGKYAKVHQPMDECHLFYHGDDFPVFDTEIGRVGLMICYDKNFPEPARELALQGADIMLASTAWGYADDKMDLATDKSYYQFDILDKVRALENQCYLISSNQFGVTGESNYFGHSNIVDPQGVIQATVGEAEGICYHDVENIKDAVYNGKYFYFGLNFIKDRRPSAYKYAAGDSVLSNMSQKQYSRKLPAMEELS